MTLPRDAISRQRWAEMERAIAPYFGKNGQVLVGVLGGAVNKIPVEKLIKFLREIDETTRALDLEKFGIKVLFRGTTKNADGSLYKGNKNSQLYGLSTSTDPLRAIVFAIESATETGKRGVIQIILPKKLGEIKLQTPNRRVHFELEVIIQSNVDDLGNFIVKEIPVEKAQKLADEFFNLSEKLPNKIYVDTYESRFLMEEVLPFADVSQAYNFYEELIKL